MPSLNHTFHCTLQQQQTSSKRFL